MNTRQKLTLGIAAIFMITLTIVGVTYAYFVTKVNGNTTDKVINVSTANLGVEYGDGNGLVTLADALPGDKVYKVFTVTNSKSSSPVAYKVTLTSSPGGVQFVHTDESKLQTDCYIETPTSPDENCYVSEQPYNSIKVTLKKYTGAEDLNSKGQDELATEFSGDSAQVVTSKTSLATLGPQTLHNTSIAGKESQNVVDTYILEVSYEAYAGNQNIENKAEVTVKVNIEA